MRSDAVRKPIRREVQFDVVLQERFCSCEHKRDSLSRFLYLRVIGFLQFLDLDLAHPKHGLHHALRLRFILIIQHVA